MRVVLAVIAITAVAALVWWRYEAAALRRRPAAVAPPAPSGSPATPMAPRPPDRPEPSRPAPAPPASPIALPTAVRPTQAPPEIAQALDRVEAELLRAARPCGSRLPDADPAQHLRLRVVTTGDRVQTLDARDGVLPPEVAACLDERLRAARWPTAAPLTLELDLSARDLR